MSAGCDGGQGSGGGWCMYLDKEGLEGGVLVTGSPTPGYIVAQLPTTH